MSMDVREMPVGEVAAIVHSAQEALEASNFEVLLKLNKEVEQVGFSLFVRDGRVRLHNDVRDQAQMAAPSKYAERLRE
jgi:hypothetical protein